MKDLTKYFIDLSKCTEEERKQIFSLLPKPELDLDYEIDVKHSFLYYDIYKWYVGRMESTDGRTEITYPEFIKLFEGGEDNNGWIKIESEADLPKETIDCWFVIDNNCYLGYFTKRGYFVNGDEDIELRFVTHYQPIIKPLPPKF